MGGSLESELVSISNVLSIILCKYFIEAQGYSILSNLLYQDNTLTILLAKNGNMVVGKNTNHTKTTFLIIDKVV